MSGLSPFKIEAKLKERVWGGTRLGRHEPPYGEAWIVSDDGATGSRAHLPEGCREIALGSPDELKASVATPDNPDPTMEDAFIALVQGSERKEAA